MDEYAEEMVAEQVSRIVKVVSGAFISPNVVDSNWEPANVVDALADIAAAIRYLADACRDGQRRPEEARRPAMRLRERKPAK